MSNLTDIFIPINYENKISLNTLEKLKADLRSYNAAISYCSPKEDLEGCFAVLGCKIEDTQIIKNIIETYLKTKTEMPENISLEEKVLKLEQNLENLIIDLRSKGIL